MSVSSLIRVSEVCSFIVVPHGTSPCNLSLHFCDRRPLWRGLFVIPHIGCRCLNDCCLVAVLMCLYRVMTHCTGFFFPLETELGAYRPAGQGAVQPRRHHLPHHRSFWDPACSAQLRRRPPVRSHNKHTHKCRPPIRVPSLRPLCCLLSFPESLFTGALPGLCDGRIFHVKEEGRCENAGGNRRMRKRVA